ncbi:hypothetical protein B0H14DRAFT_2585694 [Mycena olivaceomarginata]|nr:hypothetical protein B0H14DRAFT_2585694 [Mycena olivaceomarginata]
MSASKKKWSPNEHHRYQGLEPGHGVQMHAKKSQSLLASALGGCGAADFFAVGAVEAIKCERMSKTTAWHAREEERGWYVRSHSRPLDILEVLRVSDIEEEPAARCPAAFDLEDGQTSGFTRSGGAALVLHASSPAMVSTSTTSPFPPAPSMHTPGLRGCFVSSLTRRRRALCHWWGKAAGKDVGMWFGPSAAAGALMVSIATNGTLYQAEGFAALHSPASTPSSSSPVSVSSHGHSSSSHGSCLKKSKKWGDRPYCFFSGYGWGWTGSDKVSGKKFGRDCFANNLRTITTQLRGTDYSNNRVDRNGARIPSRRQTMTDPRDSAPGIWGNLLARGGAGVDFVPGCNCAARGQTQDGLVLLRQVWGSANASTPGYLWKLQPQVAMDIEAIFKRPPMLDSDGPSEVIAGIEGLRADELITFAGTRAIRQHRWAEIGSRHEAFEMNRLFM